MSTFAGNPLLATQPSGAVSQRFGAHECKRTPGPAVVRGFQIAALGCNVARRHSYPRAIANQAPRPD